MLFVLNAIPTTISAPNDSTMVETRARDLDGFPMALTLTLRATSGSFQHEELIPMSGGVVGQNATFICALPGGVEICVDATDGDCVKTLCIEVTCPG